MCSSDLFTDADAWDQFAAGHFGIKYGTLDFQSESRLPMMYTVDLSKLSYISGSDTQRVEIYAPDHTETVRLHGGAAGGSFICGSGPTIYEIPEQCNDPAGYTIDNTGAPFAGDANLLILHGGAFADITAPLSRDASGNLVLQLPGKPKVLLTPASQRSLVIMTDDGALFSIGVVDGRPGSYKLKRQYAPVVAGTSTQRKR